MPTPIYFNKHYLPMLQMTPAFGFKTRATMDAAQVSHKTQRQFSKNDYGVVQGATATQLTGNFSNCEKIMQPMVGPKTDCSNRKSQIIMNYLSSDFCLM